MAKEAHVHGKLPGGGLVVTFGQPKLTTLQTFQAALNRYTHTPSPETHRQLDEARAQIAKAVLTSPEPTGVLAASLAMPAAQALRDAAIVGLPLSQEDAARCEGLAAKLSERTAGVRSIDDEMLRMILALMLYRWAYQLRLPVTLEGIDQALLEPYVQFVIAGPAVFSDVGEADRYVPFMNSWLDYLHREILANPQAQRWAIVRSVFTRWGKFIPAYFNSVNVRPLYEKRGDIIEFSLRQNGFPIDYQMPPRPAGRKIRFGVLAAHYAPAPETFAALAVYEHLPADFETILYTLQPTGHRLEDYCRSKAAKFVALPQDMAQQISRIREDDLDILFIATNVTAVLNQVCILAMHRLARHQTTSVGSVVTTGIRNMDSYLSGKLTEPDPEAQTHYREKLLLLDGPAHCFTYGSERGTATYRVNRQQLGIAAQQTVFASGANVFKILPELRELWATLLAQTPGSLLMLYPYGPNWSNVYAKKNFTDSFHAVLARHGVATNRLLVLDPTPTPNRDDIKEFLKLADIYLDSYPFGGSTSIVDPLEVGLPVVVQKGRFLRSAMSAALLEDLGLPELIAADAEGYLSIARRLARDSDWRQQMKTQVAARMAASPTPSFLDAKRFSQACGDIYRAVLKQSGVIG